jgi:hypothetical protein
MPLESERTIAATGFLVVLAFFLYLLPAEIALRRRHHNRMAIVALNILLGWTVLGWIAAFVWSLTSPPPRDELDRNPREGRFIPPT